MPEDIAETWTGERWNRNPEDIALRIPIDDITTDDLLKRIQGKKEIKIEQGTRALLMHDGQLVDTLGPGKHTLESYWKRIKQARRKQDASIVLVDTSPKELEFVFDDVRSKGDFEFAVLSSFDATIENPETFHTNVMQGQDHLTREDVTEHLQRPVRNTIENVLSDHDYDEMYGNEELQKELEQEVERKCRDILEEAGLRQRRLRYFTFEDTLDDVRAYRRELRESVMKERAEVDAAEAGAELKEREKELKERDAQRKGELARTGIEEEAKTRKQALEKRRELAEGEADVEITEKTGELAKRDLESKQDKREMEDLLEVKQQLDQQNLKKEKQKLNQRGEADAQTLASLEDTDEEMSDLAKMDKAKDLDAEKLDSLGGQKSDELAKARQEANRAELQEKRVEDQKEMQDKMKGVMESAMDNMGKTASKAAEDTSDNVIVSDTSDRNTTVVNESANTSDDDKEEKGDDA